VKLSDIIANSSTLSESSRPFILCPDGSQFRPIIIFDYGGDHGYAGIQGETIVQPGNNAGEMTCRQ